MSAACPSKETLAAMGLGPPLAPHGSICCPYMPASSGPLTGCQPRVPCCSAIPLATFNPFNYPLAIGSTALRVYGTGPGLPINTPVNTASITNDTDLVAYLNTQALPWLLTNGYTVEGTGSQFQLSGASILAPKIGGSCAMQIVQPIPPP